MGENGFLKDLRGAYPTVSMKQFLAIVEGRLDDDNLFGLLDKAEALAREETARNTQLMEELETRLRGAEHHHALKFMVPSHIDLEHAQAVLMYGCFMPTQDRCFVGSHVVPQDKVRVNVEQHLGRHRYAFEKYDHAMIYLLREKVVLQTGTRARGLAISFNPNEKAKGVTLHGAQIIAIGKKFLAEKR